MSRGSVLPEGMALVGEVRGQGDLVIAGTIEGPVAIDGHLTIEASGVVRGEVKARAIVLRGTLTGPAVADETIRLEPGARMVGDARAERVSVVEGALLRGRITMTGAQATRRSSAGQVIAPRSSAGTLAAPRSSAGTVAAPRSSAGVVPAPMPSRGGALGDRPVAPVAAGVAPRSADGVLVAPREPRRDEDLEARPTGRFVRRGDALSSAEPAEDRREQRPPRNGPPAPVIPGVGRQRARRKDGGLAS